LEPGASWPMPNYWRGNHIRCPCERRAHQTISPGGTAFERRTKYERHWNDGDGPHHRRLRRDRRASPRPDTKVSATPSYNRAPSRLVASVYRIRFHWVYATDHTQTWNYQAPDGLHLPP
jgi:hypothetical protein